MDTNNKKEDAISSKITNTNHETPTQPAQFKSSSHNISFGVNKRQSRKKWWVIGVILLILVTVISWWIYYSQPNRVLADALSKTINTQTATTDNTINVEFNGDETIRVQSNIQAKSNKENAEFTTQTSVSVGAAELNIEADAILTSDKAFVRIANADDLYDALLQQAGDNKEVVETYQPVVEDIDDKWVEADIEQTEPNACTKAWQSVAANTDAAALKDIFANNQFVTVQNANDRQTEVGMWEHHYYLDIDKQKTRDFIRALFDKEEFNEIENACDINVDQLLAESDNIDTSQFETTAEVWINKFTHKPTKLYLSANGEDFTINYTANINLGADVTIETPNDTTTLEELSEKLQTP